MHDHVTSDLGDRLGSKVYVAMEQLETIDPVFLAKLQDLQAQLEKYAWQIYLLTSAAKHS